MRYLKKFETTIDAKYKDNEYVLLSEINSNKYYSNLVLNFNPYKNFAIIIDSVGGRKGVMYDINYLDTDDNFILKNLTSTYIYQSDIVRKLTSIEITEFKLKEDTNKYNI